MDDLESTARGKASQRKGSSFERKVIDIIINYFNSLGIDGLVLKYGEDIHRTEASGAGPHDKGDVIILNPFLATVFPYMIECKCVEGWTLDQLGARDGSECSDWFFVMAWEKCKEQTSRDRIPIVVFSRDRAPTYVLIEFFDFDADEDLRDAFDFMLRFDGKDKRFYILRFEEFLEEVFKYTGIDRRFKAFQRLQED